MKVVYDNPFRKAKRIKDSRNPERQTLSKDIYALLTKKDSSVIVNYKNSSTLQSTRSGIRLISLKEKSNRKFRFVDNGNTKDFTVYRIC